MRAVIRFRSMRLRSGVLPLLLGALALRALLPAQAMDGSDTSVTSALCATSSARSELIEIPGATVKTHCELCLAPPLGVPFASAHFRGLSPARAPLPAQVVSQLDDFRLARAQGARAPPHV